MKQRIDHIVRNRRDCQCRRQTESRTGSAQLELLMFMPMYVILLAVFLTIGSHSRERTAVTAAVRHQSWLRRGDTGEQTERLQLQGQEGRLAAILRGSQQADGGLIREQGSGRPSEYLFALFPGGQFEFEHCIVTDAWDYRVLTFPERGRHRALTLDPRCGAFGTVSPGIMSGLMGVAPSFTSASQQLLQQAQARRQQAMRATAQQQQRLEGILAEAVSEQRQMQEQLRTAELEETPNLVLVDDLRRRIQQKQQAIDRIRGELQQLEQVRSYLSVPA